jgi:hypothetical protein
MDQARCPSPSPYSRRQGCRATVFPILTAPEPEPPRLLQYCQLVEEVPLLLDLAAGETVDRDPGYHYLLFCRGMPMRSPWCNLNLQNVKASKEIAIEEASICLAAVGEFLCLERFR